MSDTIKQAAARLLELMAQGAEAAGQAMPEIIQVAGRYLQLVAIGQLVTMIAVMVVIGLLWRRFLVWLGGVRNWDDHPGVFFGITGLGLATFFAALTFLIEAPALIAASLDHRAALVGYLLEVGGKR